MADDYLQLGYVTNDFDRAIAEIRALHDMGPFKEMRELRLPTGRDRSGVSHYALAMKAGVQFEIIQPLEGDVGIYAQSLPSAGYALRLHHLGRFFRSSEEFRAARRNAEARWSIPVEAAVFGGFYCYADSREDLGHYSEMFTFPGEAHLDGVPYY